MHDLKICKIIGNTTKVISSKLGIENIKPTFSFKSWCNNYLAYFLKNFYCSTIKTGLIQQKIIMIKKLMPAPQNCNNFSFFSKTKWILRFQVKLFTVFIAHFFVSRAPGLADNTQNSVFATWFFISIWAVIRS